jgi:hypothetical protein
MARLSRIDWDIIDARVRAEAQRAPPRTCSCALLRLCLRQYFPGIDEALVEAVTDGPDDRGVDAIHFVEDDDHAEIFLFQSKYREFIEGTEKTLNDTEALKLAVFVEELFDRSAALAAVGNFRLRQAVARVWALHDNGVICRYNIVLCSNDAGLSHSASAILASVASRHSQVTFEHYGPADLIRDLGDSKRRRESGDLQVVGKEIFERTDGDVRGAIASIDARSFIALISTADGQSVKRHLFDDNLRVFLGASGGYNPAIIETAASKDSHLFWYLNNGITVTCRSYSFNRGHVNPQLKLQDFQIVNGAQTSHSLLEAHRLKPEALADVVLMVRVYATDRDDIAERVAVATNSQARIQDRDLRANHPVMKKLELAFAERGHFFERKRNMHSDKDPAQRIDALKLGQVITAFYLNEPDRARGESDAIFGARFNQVFNEGYDVDVLCSLSNLYRTIEMMREDYSTAHRDNMEGGGEFQYLIYGHWFILYACKLILQKNGDVIPSGDDAVQLVTQAIGLVARACSQQKAVAHYQMFRSPRTKEKILSEFMGKQGDLFVELG